ncbi:histidine phosphatase family protein [Nocardioides anomalus]|uniref:Histidine phosphatase family protein n=1 Tax=Nocardioides anomalus TaxID=2712223 RepID=A0A6G6WIW7_9ACTN|nr:histidine phosphatase family protein [Nocardioides anomalus]QIG45162.1 histidine phosphatase family protein [Nocardioides anomalus]
MTCDPTPTGAQLLLLRHGEVASHRGDVPVTEAGLVHAERTGAAVGAATDRPLSLLYGGTRRSRETAEALVRGIGDPARVTGPLDAFALRNPDMYAAGARVNMVSSAEHLAEQVPGLTAEEVDAHPWWSRFIASPDRVGWWLAHEDPPGETGADVLRRLHLFARSLADAGPHQGRLVVGVTHSPLLRALLREVHGSDPGEPAYVTGVWLRAGSGGGLEITPHAPLEA